MGQGLTRHRIDAIKQIAQPVNLWDWRLLPGECGLQQLFDAWLHMEASLVPDAISVGLTLGSVSPGAK